MEQSLQSEKDSKTKKIKPQNPWKGLFPRISAVFHCINFGVAMFLYACGYFPDKCLKILILLIFVLIIISISLDRQSVILFSQRTIL